MDKNEKWCVIKTHNFDPERTCTECEGETEAGKYLEWLYGLYMSEEREHGSDLDEDRCVCEEDYARIAWVDGCETEFYVATIDQPDRHFKAAKNRESTPEQRDETTPNPARLETPAGVLTAVPEVLPGSYNFKLKFAPAGLDGEITLACATVKNESTVRTERGEGVGDVILATFANPFNPFKPGITTCSREDVVSALGIGKSEESGSAPPEAKRIETQTPAGLLFAVPGNIPGFKSVMLKLIPKGSDHEVTVGCAMVRNGGMDVDVYAFYNPYLPYANRWFCIPRETVVSQLCDVDESIDMQANSNAGMFGVETSAGLLLAEKSYDPDNPGIWLAFAPKHASVEIDLLYAETKQEELLSPGETREDAFLYTYSNPLSEDWQEKFILRRQEFVTMLGIEDK